MQTVSASPGGRNTLADSARADVISRQIISPRHNLRRTQSVMTPAAHVKKDGRRSARARAFAQARPKHIHHDLRGIYRSPSS